ncbi:ATP-binding protein [Dactylosporangium sp. CA-092794]|uniref:ATP-binding protein n=1 Tax=Dactylosporangium sp. CA-092794 TaxID=3239929 RepID=UPI003D8FF82F
MEPAASVTLPAPLTSLVGRDAEVRTAARLLRPGGGRLLSLVGAAGSGKTRVAIAVGAAAGGAVRFADLATLGPAQEPAGFVLDALGVARRPDLGELDALLETLRAPDAAGAPLLILDNCEHVAAGVAGLAARLLAVHPEIRLLVTSRQPLGLPDETVLPVAPLDGDTALRLFETRMFERTGRPLPPEHRAAAAAICAALDGLPLAVELAAARAALLSVPEVHRLLADRFRVLADAKAAGPEHHRTLRAALDWSYQLLSPDKQALLRQLAVFQGGWSPAAAAILPAFRPGLVEALAERSLVSTPERYRRRMLQTVAAYAAARLAEHPGEAEAARDAHAAFYLDLAERAAAGVRGPRQRDWLRTLALEQDNLRAALDRLAARPGSGDDAELRLAAAMAPFQHFTGGYSQGRDWLADALQRRPDAAPAARAAASSAAADLALLACDYPAAAGLARRALDLTGAEPAARARLFMLLGSVERERARYGPSRAHLEQARELYRAAGDAWGEGRAAQLAGATAWLSGDLDAADELLAASRAALREHTDAESAASAVVHLGALAHYRGDQAAARRHLVEALDRFTELAFPEGVGWAQDLLGRVELAEDRLAAAAERLRASLAVHRRVGDTWRAASVLEALAECRRRFGDPAHAVALLGAADVVRREIGAPTPACERPLRAATDAALRAVLPAAGYERAYRFGARTPVEELLTLRSELPRPGRAPDGARLSAVAHPGGKS